METTRHSLMLRIKNPRDSIAWNQFHELYAPLLYRYARARGLSREDAEDIRATCYEILVRKMPEFEYDKSKGGFKAWLRTLVDRRVVDLLRRRRMSHARTDVMGRVTSKEPTPAEVWDQQWKNHHLRFCLDRVASDTSPDQFTAFEMLVLKGRTIEEVCEQLGINANQAYKAKSRVLKKVREKMAEIGYEEEL